MWNNSHKDRKAKDVKEKRVRQEALQHKISVDPLPEDVCAHELFTTWVSPVMRRVATEPDRLSVLRKTSAEPRKCKMEVQPFLSMPLLRPSSNQEGSARLLSNRASSAPNGQGAGLGAVRVPSRGGQDEFPPGSAGGPRPNSRCSISRAQKAASWGPGMLPEQDAMGGTNLKMGGRTTGGAEGNMLSQMRHAVMTGPTAGWPHAFETRAVGGSNIVLPAQTLPRVASAGGASAPAGANNPSQLLLEPPRSLNHTTVVDRLEAQAKAFRQTTFAEYMKENDIFTGVSKVRFDEKRLRTEEEAELRKAHLLVGGPAKRQFRLNEKR